ncbi:hypothetical protein DL769_010219 [Monosporascus sp. CRB-8-3]|nr:hypothetical protein DL769_010219 [Monosporascus sp. CRB-8-3]
MDSIKAEPGFGAVNHSDVPMAETRPSYKSWKKKYRKMRISFEERMRTSEELHLLEQKAMRTAKRLAIENDRLMDLLMDINESPQIPPERRIDVSLEDEGKNGAADKTQKPAKSLRKLLQEVPHRSYAATVDQFPEVLDDLEPKDPEMHPTSFLTANDIDEYLAELDRRLGLKPKPPVPPPAQVVNGATPAANFALRNPTSVYNWLRKHAPKTFLQDLEKEKEKDKHKDKDRDDHGNGEDDGNKKKKGGTARTKRQSAVKKEKEKVKEPAEPGDWDEEVMNYSKPSSIVKGKRKRDEDPGYRPKGGSSRPNKKRKSGGAASTK